MSISNKESLKKAHEAKQLRNVYQVKTFDRSGLLVTAYEHHVDFDCGGPYHVRLNDIDVAALRNFLSEWKNDKRTREQRRIRREQP